MCGFLQEKRKMGCNSSKMPIKEPTPLPVKQNSTSPQTEVTIQKVKPKITHEPSASEQIHEKRNSDTKLFL